MHNIREKKHFFLIGYVIGVLFIIIGVIKVIASLGDLKEIARGIIYTIAGLFIFPPFDHLIEKYSEHKMPILMSAFIFMFLFALAELI